MASVYRASVNRASLAVSIGISRYAFYGFADLYLIFVSLCEATLRANSSVVQVFYNLMFKRISYWKVSTISPPVLGYTPLILWSVDDHQFCQLLKSIIPTSNLPFVGFVNDVVTSVE